MTFSHRMLRAALPVVCLVAGLAFAAPAVAQAPQVTSEIACTSDAQCPDHGGLCFFNWLPGCGCNEGRGTCDANPKDCLAASDCFGEEICSNDNRCVEPGPRAGTPCNVDIECADWMSCIEGRCSRGECVVNGDCSDERICASNRCVRPPCTRDGQCEGGQVCRDGDCVAVECIADSECGTREICTGGRCAQVECREAADCSNCAVCDATNSCFSLCREGERCLGFPGLGQGGRFFVVRQCSDPHPACAATPECPLGQTCLGGRCYNLRDLMRDLDIGLRREFELPKAPPKE